MIKRIVVCDCCGSEGLAPGSFMISIEKREPRARRPVRVRGKRIRPTYFLRELDVCAACAKLSTSTVAKLLKVGREPE